MQLVNWNVNGIRAIIKKDFVKNIQEMNPDILCLQETKGSEEDVFGALEALPGYNVFVNSSKARKGYSGTAILTRVEPLGITYDMGLEDFDQEGRVITAEYLNFFLVTVYTPNAGEGLARLDYREQWDGVFNEYVNWLKKRKPVIVCGDLNVAHKEIDIARPKENYNRSAGFTQREIDGFQRLLDTGFVDTFRKYYPEEVKYTYWNFVTNGRAKNVGWRIDYFLVSENINAQTQDAMIYNEYHGSDHCPVGLKIEI
ncbi:MAG: exodeoxyribonuclease III [Bacteroidota bacterium]